MNDDGADDGSAVVNGGTPQTLQLPSGGEASVTWEARRDDAATADAPQPPSWRCLLPQLAAVPDGLQPTSRGLRHIPPMKEPSK